MYENGWVQKKVGTGKGHMVWHANEPVVHINFNEAENYCKWNKKFSL